jgi:hypothetical protein
LILSNGGKQKDLKILQQILKARLRQAKNYYSSAQNLPNKSSPVLYYYSFYNLVCAYLVTKGIKITSKKCNHGLSYKYEQLGSKFTQEKIQIRNNPDINNIFPMFYEKMFNKRISISSIKITNLISYCTDIAYQFSNSGFGHIKIYPSNLVILDKKERKKAWVLFAVPSSLNVSNYSKSFKNLIKLFREVTIDQHQAKTLFDFNPNNMKFFKYYQSEWEYNLMGNDSLPYWQIVSRLNQDFGNVYQSNYFEDSTNLYFLAPLQKNNQQPFNETLAIYSTMYYLSSIIRYKPEYLEKIYSNKEMWLINAFIQSCPSTFLRAMTSLITNKDYVLSMR